MLQSFDYIANEKTTTLVIGSMPGAASLEAGEYYAHPQNLFWRFVFEAFEENFDMPDYQKKTSLLLQHFIGLWDAAGTCVREGSLDSNIRDVAPNDFYSLFLAYPKIERLLFNGKKAFELFKRFHAPLLHNKTYLVLPSTSPANASIPLTERRRLWFAALKK